MNAHGWRKATASNPAGCCVEVSRLEDGMIGMRDSKDPQGPVLYFTQDEWAAFLDGASKGEFDRLAE